jgi:acetyl-CoA synthetase
MVSMHEFPIHPVPANFADAHINGEKYRQMYQRSIADRDGFWSEQALEFLHWDKPWDTVASGDFASGEARWFEGGRLNASYNCIDRHLPQRANQTAFIWEGDNPADSKHISYAELGLEVCRLANVLKARGVRKGDRVCIYMPMIPEAAYAMLACARIGAVHSVVFGGFSPEALKDRILDSDCQMLITADEGMRGGRAIPLKVNADKALESCPNVHTCLVVRRTGADVAWRAGRDVWYHDASGSAAADCPPEPMDAEDPLFILYTSGSTGRPKGVLLLVHRGRGLGHGTQLYRVRPPGQRRHFADV